MAIFCWWLEMQQGQRAAVAFMARRHAEQWALSL
jgi:hypothetical protein